MQWLRLTRKRFQLPLFSVAKGKTKGEMGCDTAMELGVLKIVNSIDKEDKKLRRNPIEDGAISGFSGQKSVPE